MLNNEGSVLYLEEKLGSVYPKNVVYLIVSFLCCEPKEKNTKIYFVISLHCLLSSIIDNI